MLNHVFLLIDFNLVCMILLQILNYVTAYEISVCIIFRHVIAMYIIKTQENEGISQPPNTGLPDPHLILKMPFSCLKGFSLCLIITDQPKNNEAMDQQ